MPFTMTMPKLTPTMEEGTIAKWTKRVGEFVEAGETLLEIATDKATVEHVALDEGYLRQILVQDGEEALVNQPIAIFTAEKEESIEGYQPEGLAPEKPIEAPVEPSPAAEQPKESPAPRASGGLVDAGIAPMPPVEGYHFPKQKEPGERIAASPLAKKLAKERGLDLSTVRGSGPSGRIVERDLDSAQPAGLVAFGRTEAPTIAPGSYEEEKLTPMRKAIGQRLQHSKTFIPHFYVTQEIDAAPLVEVRAQLKTYGVRATVNDLILRAMALALRAKPGLNSGFNSAMGKVIRFKTVDISVAVSMDEGLITPIIRHADYKSIGQISTEIRELAKRARAGKLEPEEYQGGSISLTNLGMYGVSEFIGVINPPQAAILAVGGIRDLPVVKEGIVVAGKVMALTISCDHRVADGLVVAEFLQEIKQLLENPAGLLV